MKKITVKWVKTKNDKMYSQELIVVYSNHKRFKTGSRFDLGFLCLASSEGYVIEVLPL